MSGLIWFRSDLRCDDNTALIHALRTGIRHAIYFQCPQQWQQHHLAQAKLDLIEQHLAELGSQLNALGVSLSVLTVASFNDIPAALASFCQQHGLTQIFANREPGINELRRDQHVNRAGLNLTLFDDDCVLAPGTVLNKQNELFRVFTPFKKRWLSLFAANLRQFNPEGGHPWLSQFIIDKVDNYANSRDFPATDGTSRLSALLAIGVVSARQCVSALLAKYPLALEQGQSGAGVWLSELIWREFYRHWMYAMPELSKGVCFQTKFDGLQWPNSIALFEAWCNAKTGFPIVDAAMRQLKQTNWMHNRLRMICASFLVKHCLVSWKLGEQFFMQHLIDGDLSANNGGWQWAAGTGADAAPYFRIFNPVTQSERFDADGEFIRTFLPELNNVPIKHIHAPWPYLQATGQAQHYWPPIVDLKAARQQALNFYRDV